MQWFQKFMMGRYGADPLNLAIILLSLVISIVFSFTPVAWIGSILCTILLILAIFRMFSRNTGKRAAENRVFMKFWNPVKNWFQYLWLSVRYCKKNRYFLCPHCGRIACVPRHGQGDHHLQKLPHKIRQKGIRLSFRRGGARG